MAKDTFKKLDAKKQERVLLAAAHLFAQNGFSKTDVAQIAARAGVAKGSLYNYFESKDDIYQDVCRHGLELSRQAVYEGMDATWDALTQIDHMFQKGAEFAAQNPQYVLMYLNVSSVGMERFADQISREVEKYTADHLKNILAREKREGRVRKDLNVNMAAFAINGMYILFLISLVSRHFKIRLMEYLELSEPLDQCKTQDILAQIKTMVRSLLGVGQ